MSDRPHQIIIKPVRTGSAAADRLVVSDPYLAEALKDPDEERDYKLRRLLELRYETGSTGLASPR